MTGWSVGEQNMALHTFFLLAAASFSVADPIGFCEGAAANIYVARPVPDSDRNVVLRVEETLKGTPVASLPVPGPPRPFVGGPVIVAYRDEIGKPLYGCGRKLSSRRPDPEVYPISEGGQHVSLPDPSGMRLAYVRTMIALLEKPDVKAVAAALTSDSLPVRRAASMLVGHGVLKSAAPDAWSAVGAAVVEQLPREPPNLGYQHLSLSLHILQLALQRQPNMKAEWAKAAVNQLFELTSAGSSTVRQAACFWSGRAGFDVGCTGREGDDPALWFRPDPTRLKDFRRRHGLPAEGPLTGVRNRWDRGANAAGTKQPSPASE